MAQRPECVSGNKLLQNKKPKDKCQFTVLQEEKLPGPDLWTDHLFTGIAQVLEVLEF